MLPLQLLIRNTSEVLTVEGSFRERAEQALTPQPGACVGVRDGKIAFVGQEAALRDGAVQPGTEILDAGGNFVGPGFVDPHTHLVFAGERSHEFEQRCQGASYLEIAQQGGGIASTVKATRDASEDQLLKLSEARLARLVAQGVTTAEVKSGYGLRLEDELKMLRVIRRLAERSGIDLLPTLLCAHAVPEEFKDRREAYVDHCVRDILPSVAGQGLARFFDVFAEQGAFTLEEARRLLGAAREHGLTPRLHADQLSSFGAAQLAAELKAATADHLENINEAGIRALAAAGVSAVLVPTSTLFLRMKPYAPGRKLRDAGVNVALATNLNPGSAMSENVALVLGLACLENGLSAAEAYWGFTRGAALALGLPKHGRLAVGDPADLVVFSCSSYRHVPYHLGINHARVVFKAGRRVASTDAVTCA